MLRGRAIHWFSPAQRVAPAATSESEYVALEEVNELYFLWQAKVFIVLCMGHEIRIYEGNEGVIEMANKGLGHRRTRHVVIERRIIRGAVYGEIVQVEHAKSRG